MEKRRRVHHGGQKSIGIFSGRRLKASLLCATPLQTRKKHPKTFRLDKLKMYGTSNVLNRSLCRIILEEEKISRAFKMLQNFFDDWRKIEDNIFM